MSGPRRLRCSVASVIIACLVSLTGCSVSADRDQPMADPQAPTIVSNAMVYTVDNRWSVAEAFAYDADGVIIAVGSEAEVRAAVNGDTVNGVNGHAREIDAGGNTILPGFQDPHVHVPEAGINEEVCFLPDGLGLEDYETLLADCADAQPDADWVRAAGASLFDLRATEELPVEVLDRAVPDRPAVVLDNLGHAVWTNALGLAAAGIDDSTPDPQGGVLHRDGAGRLTGLLLEDAQQLVRNAAAPDGDTNYRGLLVALEQLAENGITTISDAGGYWGQGHPAAWERAATEGTLTVRAMNTLYVYPDLPVDEQLAEFERRFSDDPKALLQFDTAKVYVDGILDLGTALLIDPYDEPVDANYPSGFRYFTTDQLHRYVDGLHAIGYRINFHVIGDLAVREALDAVANIADEPATVADRRHRATHTYLVAPADLDRFAGLGVVADFQQSPDAIDPDYHRYLAQFIGDRAFDLIPTGQLINADAAVTLSSDWDAGPLSPLGTIARSLTRETNPVPDLETAVALATIDAAYALGHDDRTGSIEVGKQADYVILNQDLFSVDVTDITKTEVLLTVLAGTEVYRSSRFDS